jgi:predicted phage baseplate assembly protein
VTVVVVPGLPARRPTPTPGLLDQIQRYLHPRRTLGTRLAVTAPDYVEVSVRVVLAAQPRVDTDRARADAESKLYAFLNPLTGGPHGRGWPFGRNVFQSELLRQLDLINGVDHVEAIELSADGVASGCGDICVGPFALVVSGTHEVSIR